MKPNPGGVILGDAVIDREKEIGSIWRALQNQSVVLISERRVGKTSILRKMEANPRDEWVPILCWVEGKQHPIELVEVIYEELIKREVLRGKFHRLKTFYTKYVGGQHIGSWQLPQIKANWKTLLDSMIQDIVDSGKKVLLMLDELPLMLATFIKKDDIGPLGTMDFLDTLRGLRNKFEGSKNIAFIFCGSVGIQLVIKDLKQNHAYNSDPINNMKQILVTGMDAEGAKELCRKLTEDEDFLERFQLDDSNKIFDYIYQQTNGLPFYIQLVFAYFYEHAEGLITKEVIDKAILHLLNAPNDEGYFKHYTDRIKTYYHEKSRDIALLILDKACKLDTFWVEQDIIEEVKSKMEIDNETIKEALDLIWRDHYLEREFKKDKEALRFRYTIMQKWWQRNRLGESK